MDFDVELVVISFSVLFDGLWLEFGLNFVIFMLW